MKRFLFVIILLTGICTFAFLPRLFAATASISPASFDYGSVAIGGSSTATFTITYTAPLAGNLNITGATVSGTSFLKTTDNCTGVSLTAVGNTCTISVQYSPASVSISNGTLTVVTNATDGTNKIALLTGAGVNGPTIGVSPASFDFGSVTIGSSSTQSFTITNTGGTGNLTVSSATVSTATFLKISDTCTGVSLPALATCTVDVQFNPTSTAVSAGTLTIVSNAANGTSQIASLSGTGVSGVTVTGSISPASFDFGNVTVGSFSTTTFTIEHTGGTGSLTITSATISGGSFLKTSDNCTGASLPAAGTCTIDVQFGPTSAAVSSGILTVVTNATNGTNKVASLTGTGVSGVTVTGSISPVAFDFGNVTVGSSSTTTLTIQNTGGTGNLTITSAVIAGSPFLKTADNCTGESLAAAESCTIDVEFNPSIIGASVGTLAVLTNATNGTTKIVSLRGRGVSGVTVTAGISPASFDYGSVDVEDFSTATFTITNTGGTGNLDITSAEVSGPPFVITSDNCTGASLAALPDTCTIDVEFGPTGGGVFAGTLTVLTNATNGINKIAALHGKSSSSSPSPGVIGFSAAEYQFNEDVGTATIYVSRTGGSWGEVTVDYSTVDGTASVSNGDYAISSNPSDLTLSWADGDSSAKTIGIVITPDSFLEGNRQFSVVLTDVTGGAALGDSKIATITILASEEPGGFGDGGCSLTANPMARSQTIVWGMLAILVGFILFRFSLVIKNTGSVEHKGSFAQTRFKTGAHRRKDRTTLGYKTIECF